MKRFLFTAGFFSNPFTIYQPCLLSTTRDIDNRRLSIAYLSPTLLWFRHLPIQFFYHTEFLSHHFIVYNSLKLLSHPFIPHRSLHLPLLINLKVLLTNKPRRFVNQYIIPSNVVSPIMSSLPSLLSGIVVEQGDSEPALYGTEFLNSVIYAWRHIREKTVHLSERARSAEDNFLAHMSHFQVAHHNYSTLQREIDGVPPLTSSLASLSTSVSQIADKLNRVELALDFVAKEREQDKILQADLEHSRRLITLRRKLYAEHNKAKADVDAARTRQYEQAVKKTRADMKANLDNAMALLTEQSIAAELLRLQKISHAEATALEITARANAEVAAVVPVRKPLEVAVPLTKMKSSTLDGAQVASSLSSLSSSSSSSASSGIFSSEQFSPRMGLVKPQPTPTATAVAATPEGITEIQHSAQDLAAFDSFLGGDGGEDLEEISESTTKKPTKGKGKKGAKTKAK